ncbi:MAG: hypothetical protein KAS16_01225, partial [Thermoplasmata archaeon]|nr:hypothetical protein [Thermoplasmata archaeon]
MSDENCKADAKLIGNRATGFQTGNTEHKWDLDALRASHKVLAEYVYEKKPIVKGYAGRTLYVDLTTKEIREIPVTEDMKKKFT